MNRADILTEAQRLTSHDRNTDYDEPVVDFGRTAAMVNAMWSHLLDHPISPADVADFLICVKLSRKQKSPTKADHYVDIAGYAACGGECATEHAHPNGEVKNFLVNGGDATTPDPSFYTRIEKSPGCGSPWCEWCDE